MRFLSICSYICAAAAIVMGVISLQAMMSGASPASALILIVLTILLPGIMQFVYTIKTGGAHSLKTYKETKSLDDFMLNDMEVNTEIITTSAWQKIFNVINCVLLCLVFIGVSYVFRSLIREASNLSYSEPAQFTIPLILVIYVFSLPTVFYNVRTFNMKRIRM